MTFFDPSGPTTRHKVAGTATRQPTERQHHPDFDKPAFDSGGQLRQGSDFSEALASLQLGINLGQDQDKEQQEISIGSHHGDGVHVLMCDGRVQFLTESLDEEIRHALGSKSDGERYIRSTLQ